MSIATSSHSFLEECALVLHCRVFISAAVVVHKAYRADLKTLGEANAIWQLFQAYYLQKHELYLGGIGLSGAWEINFWVTVTQPWLIHHLIGMSNHCLVLVASPLLALAIRKTIHLHLLITLGTIVCMMLYVLMTMQWFLKTTFGQSETSFGWTT